jgi:hypothetical protein
MFTVGIKFRSFSVKMVEWQCGGKEVKPIFIEPVLVQARFFH